MKSLYPIKLLPVRKEYIWGTEDWMLSWLQEGFEKIPLLVKIITAQKALSVQVHPGNEYARDQENGSGKTEMWYILDCKPDAYLYYGLKHKITPNEFRKRIQNDSILEVCRKVPVKKGDVFYIPAGLLHAIGEGITIAEIQQSSNITYRVYDYHREDENCKPRPLHIDKAAQVTGFMPPLQGHRPMGARVKKEGFFQTLLIQCPYFTVHRYEIETQMINEVTDSFQSVLVIEGEGTLITEKEQMLLKKGESIFFPEGMGTYQIKGKLELLISEV